MATKVKLRRKPISKGRESLYLDFYPPIVNEVSGEKTRKQFLKMYVHTNPKHPLDKQHNSMTLELAEQTRQKRENEVNKPEVYSEYEKEQLKWKQFGESSFLDYYKRLMRKRQSSNHDNWQSALKYLEAFTKGKLRFDQLNERFCNDFRDYLLTTKSNKSSKTTLSQNSAASYFNKFKATLKQAFREGYLKIDLSARIDPIKEAETRRNFMTLEELKKLNKTECRNPQLKNAAIFSALTGLRFSDIQKLTWQELEHIEGRGYFIHYKQRKTEGIEVQPISDEAFKMLGERGDPKDLVFQGLTYSAYHNKHLYQWIGAAGITKDITFHSFRHTYATLQLSLGTDIYTISKLLGHRDLKSTQVYAKIVDKLTIAAANKIKLDS